VGPGWSLAEFDSAAGQEQVGKHFVNSLPAVSKDAVVAMGREIRSWHIAKRSDKSLDDLARMLNNIVQGGSTITDASTSPCCIPSSGASIST
jgi:hypothetical protein